MSKGVRFWRSLVRAICLFLLVVAAGWYAYLNGPGQAHTDRSLDIWLNLLHICGWIGAVGAAAVVLNAGMSSKMPGRWIWTRIGDAVTALGCIALFWFAWICNFLSLGTKF